MWQRLTITDVRIIGHYLGMLLILFALAMLPPLVCALAYAEWSAAARYVLGAGVAVVMGSLLRLLHVHPAQLSRRQALVVTGLAWVVLAFVATVPLYFSGHYLSYLDAVFDCVSGLTTTGASVIQDLDHLSNADNMFRFVMHAIGGLGLIVVAISLGLFGKGGGAALYSSEARTDHVVPNVVQTARFIARITLVFVVASTLVLTVICLLLGMEPARAVLQSLWLAVSGFLTGGFAPMSQSIMYYHSPVLELCLMILMVLGSINFLIYAEVWNGRLHSFLDDIEIHTMVLWLAVMTCIIAASLSLSPSFSGLPALLRRGLFMIIACFSTTGFQVVSTDQLTTVFTSGAFLALAICMAVGGGAGSTAGGIKFNRVGIILKSLAETIKRTLAPDSACVVVTYHHAGRCVLSDDVVREATTVFVLFVATYVGGTLAGIAYGYEASQAIFESVAMTSNGGLVAGIVCAGMPEGLEVIYIVLMWAGRLEFVTFLALVVQVLVSIRPRPRRKVRP